MLALRVPAWYQPQPVTPESHARAEALERRVLSELSAAHRFGDPWTLTLAAQDAEAWLNARLPVWLENQRLPKPAWLGAAGISFEPGQARVGIALRPSGAPPLLSLALAESKPWPPSIRLGSIPAPNWLTRSLAPDLEGQLSRVRGETDPTALATIRLDDGRRVHITRLTPAEGTLTLHCETIGKR